MTPATAAALASERVKAIEACAQVVEAEKEMHSKQMSRKIPDWQQHKYKADVAAELAKRIRMLILEP